MAYSDTTRGRTDERLAALIVKGEAAAADACVDAAHDVVPPR